VSSKRIAFFFADFTDDSVAPAIEGLQGLLNDTSDDIAAVEDDVATVFLVATFFFRLFVVLLGVA
jgi:hypothetical protein